MGRSTVFVSFLNPALHNQQTALEKTGVLPLMDSLPSFTPSCPRVSVVIPVLNEERNLPYVAARMPGDVHEVIVVDGRSVDGTVQKARELWPNGIHLTQSRSGKGNALACGFAAATGDIVVMIDADCSTDPAEIPAFVGALIAGADFAKGSRFILGGGSADITPLRKFGNGAGDRAEPVHRTDSATRELLQLVEVAGMGRRGRGCRRRGRSAGHSGSGPPTEVRNQRLSEPVTSALSLPGICARSGRPHLRWRSGYGPSPPRQRLPLRGGWRLRSIG